MVIPSPTRPTSRSTGASPESVGWIRLEEVLVAIPSYQQLRATTAAESGTDYRRMIDETNAMFSAACDIVRQREDVTRIELTPLPGQPGVGLDSGTDVTTSMIDVIQEMSANRRRRAA